MFYTVLKFNSILTFKLILLTLNYKKIFGVKLYWKKNLK
jgi:hypothetical protein